MNPYETVEPSPDMEAEIRRIGLAAAPYEACGIVFANGTVVRLPNRAHGDRRKTYFLSRMDIIRAVEEQLFNTRDVMAMALWHTHPSGLVGPSRGDIYMMKKLELGAFNQFVYALPNGPLVRF